MHAVQLWNSLHLQSQEERKHDHHHHHDHGHDHVYEPAGEAMHSMHAETAGQRARGAWAGAWDSAHTLATGSAYGLGLLEDETLGEDGIKWGALAFEVSGAAHAGVARHWVVVWCRHSKTLSKAWPSSVCGALS